MKNILLRSKFASTEVKKILPLIVAIAALFAAIVLPKKEISLVLAALLSIPMLIRSFKRISQPYALRDTVRQFPTRLLLAQLPLVLYAEISSINYIEITSIFIIVSLPLTLPLLARVIRSRRLRVQNLPGIQPLKDPLIGTNVILIINLLATLVMSLLVLIRAEPTFYIITALVPFTILIVALIDSWLRVKYSLQADKDLRAAIEFYEPKFILYYGVNSGTEYQVKMWLPYLERIGAKFIVVLRHTRTFNKIREMTSAPIVVRTSMKQLDDVVVPTVRAAFYVNNGALNTHLIRYPMITHVQLLHGDSDKSTSFNPITAMFDKIFVAGQAGIDRYHKNGINIPTDKFEIVGRPQVEQIEVRSTQNRPVSTVLYAPTWQGHFSDTNYSSLPVGAHLIESLLKRGKTIIFRPHPYSYRHSPSLDVIKKIHGLLSEDKARTGLDHKWGAAAETEYGIFDCFNHSDALISDVSSVVPDFLYSEKPFGLIATTGSITEFKDEFPLASAAYVIDRELSNLESTLDQILVDDPQQKLRQKVKTYYLGQFPTESYATGFVNAAKNIVEQEIDTLSEVDTIN